MSTQAHTTLARHTLTLALGITLGWLGHAFFVQQHHAQAPGLHTTQAMTPATNAVATTQRAPVTTRDNEQHTAADTNDHTVDFADALKSLNASELADWLDNARQQRNPLWESFNAQFKQTLKAWLDTGKDKQVIDYSNAYLQRFYSDDDVLYLLALAYHHAQQPMQAIKTLYMLKTRTALTTTAQKIGEDIHQLVDSYRQSLQQQQQWKTLQALDDFLVIAEPDNTRYFLEQARTQIMLGNFAHARLALAHVYDDPALAAEARALAQQMARVEQGEVRIPLQARNGSFALQATLDENLALDMLIDTGASISALSRASFNKLANDSKPVYVDTLTVNTANGSVQAPRYRFSQLSLQGSTVYDVEFVILDELPKDHALLGMNVLQQFRFEIDQQQQQLLLNPL